MEEKLIFSQVKPFSITMLRGRQLNIEVLLCGTKQVEAVISRNAEITFTGTRPTEI